MSKCYNKVSVYVAKGYGYKEIKMPCGSTSIDGGVNLCDVCEDAMSKQHPQGWRAVPGDTCKHGNYIGDASGPDYLCGKCEDEL